MYAYFSFYYGLIVFTIVSSLLTIVSPWYSLLGIVPLAVIVLNRFQCFRIRCRSYPGLCRSAPKTEEELIALKENTIVGNSWSFFLNKRAPENPIFTYNFSSTEPENGFWKSGTLLKTVAAYYEKRGLAFPSLPSYQNITLGGWIMTESHGSSGDIGEGSSSRFKSIKYVLRNRVINRVIIEDWKDFVKDKTMLILGVKFDMSNSKNILLHKKRVNNIEEWLQNGAYQRACFIGKRRDVMIRWEIPTLNFGYGTHRDPHFCSRFCLWFQADICTAVTCGLCLEGNEAYDSIVRLAEANRFVPQIYPIFTIFLPKQVNFEKIIKQATKDDVIRYYKKIKAFHEKHGGRTEIRYGAYLFIDVSIPIHLVKEYTRIIPEGTYHLGKYQPVWKSAHFSLKL